VSDDVVNVQFGPLAEWPADRLERAWRLVAGTTRRLSELPADDPERMLDLEWASADAEMFGRELIRRRLI
jgi:hypothetical protein